MREKIPESAAHFDRFVGDPIAFGGVEGKNVAKDAEGAIGASGMERVGYDADHVTGIERKKAKETGEADKQLFQIAADYVQAFAMQYGANMRDSSSDILNSIARKDETLINGAYNMWSGNIEIEEGKDIEKLTTMIHELLHRQSFHSVTLVSESSGGDRWLSDSNPRYTWQPLHHLRRNGISIFPGNKEELNEQREKIGKKEQMQGRYFEELDEAITAECNRRIWKKVAEDPRFKELFKSSEFVKTLLRAKMQIGYYSKAYIDDTMSDILLIEDADKILNTFQSAASLKSLDSLFDQAVSRQQGGAKILFAERWGERNTLQGIIDELFEKGGGRFKDKEEVFTLFANAHFTGQILPLARTVDGILGKGAFRKMAEDTASGELKTKPQE